MSSQIYHEVMKIVTQIEKGTLPSDAQMFSILQSLEKVAEGSLRSNHGSDEIRAGVMAKLAAIELDPASKAIQTAAALTDTKASKTSSALMMEFAKKRAIAACAFILELPADIKTAASTARAPVASAPSMKGGTPDLAVLRNIATYHREHERYYTWYKASEAADMFHDANRLKAVASTWRDEKPLPPLAGEFSDPRLAAAGCHDLNSLRSIGSIGILFMEGEQEPAEILSIKAKLNGVGQNWLRSGSWLAEKMVHAWMRESVALHDDWIDAAEPRFGTILTNWRGSRHMELAGRCALLALEILTSIDLRPAAIRADRRMSGQRLLDAAWTIDYAAQVIGRSAIDLSENDKRWTRYLDFIGAIPEAAE